MSIEDKKYRVWHIPQIPGNPFSVDVKSVHEGVRVMNLLANYDEFQLRNNIKGDYASTQGIQEYHEDFDGEGTAGWGDWCDEESGENDPLQWVTDNPE